MKKIWLIWFFFGSFFHHVLNRCKETWFVEINLMMSHTEEVDVSVLAAWHVTPVAPQAIVSIDACQTFAIIKQPSPIYHSQLLSHGLLEQCTKKSSKFRKKYLFRLCIFCNSILGAAKCQISSFQPACCPLSFTERTVLVDCVFPRPTQDFHFPISNHTQQHLVSTGSIWIDLELKS